MNAAPRPTAPGSPRSLAPEPRGVAASPRINQGHLPLAFMGLAIAWLLVGTVLLVRYQSLLLVSHAHPHVVALVHVWVLGFFVTAACGASYQIAPVALGTSFPNKRYGWWHLGLHTIGVLGMVVMLWRWDLAQVGHFGTLVAMGAGLFTVSIRRIVRTSQHRSLVTTSLNAASRWLLLTVTLGLIIAANRFWGFIPLDPLPLLRAHAHAGIAGFFVTLLQGVTFQLIPMVTLAEVRSERMAATGFWISQITLLTLIPSLILQIGWFSFAVGIAFLGGCALTGVSLWQTVRTRRKRKLDPGVAAFLTGGMLLLLSAAIGVILVCPLFPGGSASRGINGTFYGVIILLGGLLLCFTGLMGKIVPFLIWISVYGPHVGHRPTPSVANLGLPRVERAGQTLQVAALGPLLWGIGYEHPFVLSTGVAVLALGVSLVSINLLWILRHLWLPRKAFLG